MRIIIPSIIKAARPRLWIKNLGLFLPLILAGKLFDFDLTLQVFYGCIAFCFLSSSNYILNDILDATTDKKHPIKRNRPLANNAITLKQSIIATLVTGIIGLTIAYFINIEFFYIAVLFVVIHHLSYFFFRKMAILDVLAIGSGYLLRIIAGEYAVGITMSVWFFLAVLSGSLLLAIGKRRHEYSLIEKVANKNEELKKEHNLYTEKILDSYVAVFSSATFVSYTYFTFLTSSTVTGFIFQGYTDFLIQVLGRKWLMITVPFVLYGIMRYLQLVYRGNEMLAKVVTSDYPLMITSLLWVISMFIVIYGIGG